MTDTITDLEARLRKVVGDILSVDSDAVDEQARFVEHYGGDSMLAIEILAQLEREFGVEIPEETLPRLVNLAGAREVVREVVAAGTH